MSSQTESVERGIGQQTLHEAINSQRIHEPIRGVHPRVELPDEHYESWLENNRYIEYVMINLSDAIEVVRRDGDLNHVLEPWHIPVILGTEDDEVVDRRILDQILTLLATVQPAIYVPDVVYNYQNMDEDEQELAILAYISHVTDLQEKITERDLNIRQIPTNKGWKYEHFLMYKDLFERFNYTEFAYYCVQYTGGNAGNATRKLRRHTTHAVAALNLENLFLIGRLARKELLRFGPRVQGACGLRQWKTYCKTRGGLSQARFPDLQDRLEAALFANNNERQSYMTKFTETEEAE